MLKNASTSVPTVNYLHATPRLIDGVSMPWPVSPSDLRAITAWIKENPGNSWPSRLASEWDLTEGVARRLIRESLRQCLSKF